MMDLLIHNARQVVTVAANGERWKRGREMNDVGVLEHASIAIDKGSIVFVGASSDVSPKDFTKVIDASDRVALPGFVDSHTHLVFAGSREIEFVKRNAGATYAEIAAAGGGINTTVKATRAASKEELVRLGLDRLDSALHFGTTTIEIKTGYGLDFDDELKMLEAIADLREQHVIDIAATFLGAHTIPFDYKERREEYVSMLLERLIPEVGSRKLAEFCDVFCERNVFSVDESRAILSKAKECGMKPKLHADQLTALGGSKLAAELRAVSADHLDHVDDDSIAAMNEANVVATVLPGVSLFLDEPMANARKLVDAGLPLAIATDFNPGSCMSENIQLMMSLGAMKMRLTPEECITAVTLNAAAALDRSDTVGSIEAGKRADVLLFAVPNYSYILYHFGINHLTDVIKNGSVVLETSTDSF